MIIVLFVDITQTVLNCSVRCRAGFALLINSCWPGLGNLFFFLLSTLLSVLLISIHWYLSVPYIFPTSSCYNSVFPNLISFSLFLLLLCLYTVSLTITSLLLYKILPLFFLVLIGDPKSKCRIKGV